MEWTLFIDLSCLLTLACFAVAWSVVLWRSK